jgi:polyisoprenoid-binding protein YceI
MTTTWKIDPAHSEIQFKARHLMITTVTGHFSSYSLLVETEDNDFTKATKIEFSADPNSIITGEKGRDDFLKSTDFFDTAEHSLIIFKGTKLEKSGEDYRLSGALTIKGITKPITLDVEYGGIAVDSYKQTKAGFSITGKLSRKEFGLTWNAVTEAGNLLVGDEVKLSCEVQLIKG